MADFFRRWVGTPIGYVIGMMLGLALAHWIRRDGPDHVLKVLRRG